MLGLVLYFCHYGYKIKTFYIKHGSHGRLNYYYNSLMHNVDPFSVIFRMGESRIRFTPDRFLWINSIYLLGCVGSSVVKQYGRSPGVKQVKSTSHCCCTSWKSHLVTSMSNAFYCGYSMDSVISVSCDVTYKSIRPKRMYYSRTLLTPHVKDG